SLCEQYDVPAEWRGQPAGVEKERRGNEATLLVQLAKEVGAEFFHTLDGELYVTVPVASHRETYPLHSPSFTRYLRRLAYERTTCTPRSQAIADARAQCDAIAAYSGIVHPVHLRIAALPDRTYVDLGDDAGRVVEITGGGCRVLTDSPVRFRRQRGMALPV